MSLKAVTRTSGSVCIIDLSGKITLGEGAGILRDAVKDALAKGSKNLLLNMAEVSYVDSAGLGELVGSYSTTTSGGGQLKLVNVQKKMKDLMQITKLYTIFQAFDDEAAALQSFNAPASA